MNDFRLVKLEGKTKFVNFDLKNKACPVAEKATIKRRWHGIRRVKTAESITFNDWSVTYLVVVNWQYLLFSRYVNPGQTESNFTKFQRSTDQIIYVEEFYHDFYLSLEM